MIAPGVIVILEVTATRVAEPVSDETELDLYKTAVPENTKSTTEWGIHTWNDWAANRCVFTADVSGISYVTTLLLDMTPTNLSYWMSKLVLQFAKKMVVCIP